MRGLNKVKESFWDRLLKLSLGKRCGLVASSAVIGSWLPVESMLNSINTINTNSPTNRKGKSRARARAWLDFVSTLVESIQGVVAAYGICQPKNCLAKNDGFKEEDKEWSQNAGSLLMWKNLLTNAYVYNVVVQVVASTWTCNDPGSVQLLTWVDEGGNKKAASLVTLALEISSRLLRAIGMLSHSRRYIDRRRLATIRNAISAARESKKKNYRVMKMTDSIKEYPKEVQEAAHVDWAWDAMSNELEFLGMANAIGMVGAAANHIAAVGNTTSAPASCARHIVKIADNVVRLIAQFLGWWGCLDLYSVNKINYEDPEWVKNVDKESEPFPEPPSDSHATLLEAGRYRVAKGKWQTHRHRVLASKILNATGLDLDRFADSLWMS